MTRCSLNCTYWFESIKWPVAMFVSDCCSYCHHGKCTPAFRSIAKLKFVVCCKVGNLCFKRG